MQTNDPVTIMRNQLHQLMEERRRTVAEGGEVTFIDPEIAGLRAAIEDMIGRGLAMQIIQEVIDIDGPGARTVARRHYIRPIRPVDLRRDGDDLLIRLRVGRATYHLALPVGGATNYALSRGPYGSDTVIGIRSNVCAADAAAWAVEHVYADAELCLA